MPGVLTRSGMCKMHYSLHAVCRCTVPFMFVLFSFTMIHSTSGSARKSSSRVTWDVLRVPRSLLRVSVKEEQKFPCGGETGSLSGLRFIVRSPLIRLFDFGCKKF
jgi:hypothetical protein